MVTWLGHMTNTKVSNISVHTKIAYLVDFTPQNVITIYILRIRYVVSLASVAIWLIWAWSMIEGCGGAILVI